MHLIIPETNLFLELSFRISLRLLSAALAKGQLGRGLPERAGQPVGGCLSYPICCSVNRRLMCANQSPKPRLWTMTFLSFPN